MYTYSLHPKLDADVHIEEEQSKSFIRLWMNDVQPVSPSLIHLTAAHASANPRECIAAETPLFRHNPTVISKGSLYVLNSAKIVNT